MEVVRLAGEWTVNRHHHGFSVLPSPSGFRPSSASSSMSIALEDGRGLLRLLVLLDGVSTGTEFSGESESFVFCSGSSFFVASSVCGSSALLIVHTTLTSFSGLAANAIMQYLLIFLLFFCIHNFLLEMLVQFTII